MRRIFSLLLVFAAITACLSSGMAYFTMVSYDSQKDYLEGTLSGLQLTPDGQLTLSGSFEEKWCEETESACWVVEAAANDVIYAATGNDGRVYEHQNGKTDLVFDAPQVAIFSLLPLKGGSLLVGAAPDGIVYKVDSKGAGQVFYRSNAHYIWDMIQEPDGSILLATGLPASVIRIDQTGKELGTFELKAEHARTMTMDHKNRVWIGSADTGRIYHLDGQDLQLVYETHASEISSMVAMKDGLYFATVAAPAIKGSGSDRAENLDARKRAGGQLDEHGDVYFLDYATRSTREVLTVKSAPIFDMLAYNGKPVLVCGDDGYLVEINDVKRASLLGALKDHPLVSVTSDSKGRLWLGSAGAACLYLFDENGRSASGSFESEPIDAGNLALWGRIACHGEHLSAESLKLETRTGNSEEPEDDWSDWSPASGGEGKIISPPGRYLQYRLTLNDVKGKTPLVNQVKISVKTANNQPYVKSVTVYPVVKGVITEKPGRGKAYHQKMPDGLRIDYTIPTAQQNGLSKGMWMKLTGMRTISWNAGDHDNDKLSYKVEITRSNGPEKWFMLDDNIKNPVYSFDSTVFSDGSYRVRVTADDVRSHPVEDALTASLVSRPFVIDNSSPMLQALKTESVAPTSAEGWKMVISGVAVDGESNVSALEYSMNTEDWFNFTSSDGMLDNNEEPFRLILKGSEGSLPSQVFIRVTDAQENVFTSTVRVEN